MVAWIIGTGALVIAALFVVIVLPVWIVSRFLSQWRSNRRISGEDEKRMGELWEVANRMENRVANLEKILDSETPGWRSKYDRS